MGKCPAKTPGLPGGVRDPEERDVFQRLSAGSLLPVEEFGLSPRVGSVGARAPRNPALDTRGATSGWLVLRGLRGPRGEFIGQF